MQIAELLFGDDMTIIMETAEDQQHNMETLMILSKEKKIYKLMLKRKSIEEVQNILGQ